MRRLTTRHLLASVLLCGVFALVDSLKDPMSHLDLRELARVVSCRVYCVNVREGD